MSNNSQQTPPMWTKFAVAGLGGATGWLPIHPFDVCKVRMQINLEKGGTIMNTFKGILQNEGITGLYKGLSAGLTRQLTYTTLRLGLYDVIRYQVAGNSDNINVWQKLGIGLTAGGIAATICNPVEVALVRMQADGSQKDITKKRNYKHIFDAIYKVNKEEGFIALYKGVRPTVVRGMIVSCVQLGSYDQAKTMLKYGLNFEEGVILHLSSAVISGFLYSLASLPMDIAKTRMQNQYEIIYRNIPQTLVKVATDEGFFSLWKGFAPYFARSGGHTITMFLAVEQYRNLFKTIYN